MSIEFIANYNCIIGEGPTWHPIEKKLYWLDIGRGRMFCYDPATNYHEQCYEGETIGGITVQADGSLLLFMTRGSIAIWRDKKLEFLKIEFPGEETNRFNDVIADPEGRVFCGTMSLNEKLVENGERSGKLYRLDIDGTVEPVIQKTGIPNGMGFTSNLKAMYFTDTMDQKIYQFDYDRKTGEIANKRIFIDTYNENGNPDGMTVDEEGFVWSANWGGSTLHRYHPNGSEERHIRFTAKNVSSVTFGGDNYSDIYVTTAGGQDKTKNGHDAGALFRTNLGINGKQEFLSRIKI